jgi:hypothetical protein
MAENRHLNRNQAKIVHKQPIEDPEYSPMRPEKPELVNGPGTTKHGSTVHGSYKQPWVEHDGVCDPTGDEKIG